MSIIIEKLDVSLQYHWAREVIMGVGVGWGGGRVSVNLRLFKIKIDLKQNFIKKYS